MNRRTSAIFLITLIQYILCTGPSPSAIISIASSSSSISNTPIEVSLDFTSILDGDIVYFATSVNSLVNELSIQFTTPINTPITKSLPFTEAGIYNLYLKRNGDIVEQTNTGVQLVITPPAPPSDAIIGVTPLSAKAGEATLLTFTLQSLTSLAVNDVIILSIKNGPISSDPEIDVLKVPTALAFTGSVTFKIAGLYHVFIDNGTITKQTTTDLSILVSHANYFSILLMLILYMIMML